MVCCFSHEIPQRCGRYSLGTRNHEHCLAILRFVRSFLLDRYSCKYIHKPMGAPTRMAYFLKACEMTRRCEISRMEKILGKIFFCTIIPSNILAPRHSDVFGSYSSNTHKLEQYSMSKYGSLIGNLSVHYRFHNRDYSRYSTPIISL